MRGGIESDVRRGGLKTHHAVRLTLVGVEEQRSLGSTADTAVGYGVIIGVNERKSGIRVMV